jgi:hypothetical protein
MQDQEFYVQFENCTLPKEYFRHYGHLRICWINLSRHELDIAMPLITAGIKRYAASLGAAHIYHETLTRAWIYLVHEARDNIVHATFEDFITHHQELMDKSLPYQYYSDTILNSETAKQTWIAPDITPFNCNIEK